MLVRNIKYALRSQSKLNIYIGRGDSYRKASPLANPFRVTYYTDPDKDKAERARVNELYRIWLWKRMQSTDPTISGPIWAELRKITANSILLCHCYPKLCHGHVIKAAWTWAYQQGLIPQRGVSDAARIERIADVNRKALEPAAQRKVELDKAELTMRSNVGQSKALMDAQRDETILQGMLAPQKKQPGRGKPRTTKGLCYITPDIRYNDLDDMQADLAELPQVVRWTETVWTKPTVLAASA